MVQPIDTAEADSKTLLPESTSKPETMLPAKLQFEYARLKQEKDLKEREFVLQIQEMRWNRWGNPAFVAIVAGLIGYLGTLFSSYTTHRQEIERQKNSETLEQKNREATLQLAREKQEGTLILEAIKTGGAAANKEITTAANLVFLADAGLITTLSKEKLERLRQIAGDTLPSLPGPYGIEFQTSDELTKELQAKLGKALSEYQTYLAGIGFKPDASAETVGVRVEKAANGYAYFSGANIVLGADLASEPEYVLTAYTWEVLKQSNPNLFEITLNQPFSLHLEGFCHGLKFYFVCSYFNDPRVDKNFFALSGLRPPKKGQTYTWNLATSNVYTDAISKSHDLGEIWGAAFWDIRAKVGRSKADKLIFAAWVELKLVTSKGITPQVLVKAIIDANQKMGAIVDAVTLREILQQRHLL